MFRATSQPADLQLVLSTAPWLMNEALVKLYYSDGLLSADLSKNYWRHPDLRDLAVPGSTTTTRNAVRQIIHVGRDDDHRLARFAFAVVKYCLSHQHRRGFVVKHALSALQTSTVHLRAVCPSIPSYSETQAYFWIQVIHSASSLRDHETSSICHCSFRTFLQRSHIALTEWKKYYSSRVWNSMQACIAFVPPDIKALPSVLLDSTSDHF